MPGDDKSATGSRAMWVAGIILSGLPALFLLVDGAMKLVKPDFVVEGTVKLGYAESVIVPLGVVLLVCTVLYLIPRTAVLVVCLCLANRG